MTSRGTSYAAVVIAAATYDLRRRGPRCRGRRSELAQDQHRARGDPQDVACLDTRARLVVLVGAEHDLAGLDPVLVGEGDGARLGVGVEPDEEGRVLELL